MVRPSLVALAVVVGWSLGCIGVSGNPTGRYEIRSFTVSSATGHKDTVENAGALQFFGILSCDSGWALEEGPIDACEVDQFGSTAMSEITYDWVGSGLVPIWDPQPVLFELPEWIGDKGSWNGPLPLGTFSCVLVRESQNPLVLVGKACDGPSGGPFDIEMVMDR